MFGTVMSDAGGTCEYVLDPDDPETWGGGNNDRCYIKDVKLNQDGVWACQRGTEENEDFCIFHKGVDKKDDEKVRSEFIISIENPSHRNDCCFIGGKFGDLNIKNLYIQDIDYKINLNHSEFYGELNAQYSDINSNLTFRGSRLSETDFSGANINGKLDFLSAEFEEWAHFSRVSFYGGTNFGSSVFKNGASFVESEFGASADFQDAVFISGPDRPPRTGAAAFTNADFKRSAYFSGAKCEQGGRFGFSDANIQDANMRGAHLTDARFTRANLIGANISSANLDGAVLQQANLTEANLSNASLSGAELNQAIITRANLFSADLIGASFYGAIFSQAQINGETTFGDRCVNDPEFDGEFAADIHADKTERLNKAAGQYRIIEKIARENAFPDMVGQNFIRRQDIHREQHQQRGRWGRWLRATASKYVLEYGENPWRLIATGLIIVVGFGLLYPLVGGLQPTGGSPITASRVIENPLLLAQSIYYSTLTFTTLGMGDFLPVGLGRVLTTLETSLGAIIIALLVFVFGRRAAR